METNKGTKQPSAGVKKPPQTKSPKAETPKETVKPIKPLDDKKPDGDTPDKLPELGKPVDAQDENSNAGSKFRNAVVKQKNGSAKGQSGKASVNEKPIPVYKKISAASMRVHEVYVSRIIEKWDKTLTKIRSHFVKPRKAKNAGRFSKSKWPWENSGRR